jgi:hypothetical protein
MKRLICLLALGFFSVCGYAQPGKYAGSKKSLIGKEHTTLDSLSALKGWQMMEGSVMNENPMTDPELHMVSVYKKGTTCLIIFSVREDTASDKAVVADVVEVAGVLKGWAIRTWACRQNKKPSNYIVAWAKETNAQYMKPVKKAWRFNPDKRRVEPIPVTGVDCENETGC